MSQAPLTNEARTQRAANVVRWQPAAAAALLAALLTASIAGCGTQPAPTAVFPPATSSHGGTHNVRALAADVTCPSFAGGLSPGTPMVRADSGTRIPRGFTPVAVVQCERSVVRVKGRGLWLAEVKRIATSGLGPLMTELRKPSSTIHAGGPVDCPLILAVLPWFELVGKNGRVIQPAIPSGFCDQPESRVLAALDKLHWRTVSKTLVEKYKAVLDPPDAGQPDAGT